MYETAQHFLGAGFGYSDKSQGRIFLGNRPDESIGMGSYMPTMRAFLVRLMRSLFQLAKPIYKQHDRLPSARNFCLRFRHLAHLLQSGSPTCQQALVFSRVTRVGAPSPIVRDNFTQKETFIPIPEAPPIASQGQTPLVESLSLLSG
jgi:hypothetical protein